MSVRDWGNADHSVDRYGNIGTQSENGPPGVAQAGQVH